MAKVEFIRADGTSKIVDSGSTLHNVMEIARRHNIPGIAGDCGGFMACATCHVYVAPEWTDKVGPATGEEKDMLEFTEDVRPESRLGCQIWVTADIEGLKVTPVLR